MSRPRVLDSGGQPLKVFPMVKSWPWLLPWTLPLFGWVCVTFPSSPSTDISTPHFFFFWFVTKTLESKGVKLLGQSNSCCDRLERSPLSTCAQTLGWIDRYETMCLSMEAQSQLLGCWMQSLTCHLDTLIP